MTDETPMRGIRRRIDHLAWRRALLVVSIGGTMALSGCGGGSSPSENAADGSSRSSTADATTTSVGGIEGTYDLSVEAHFVPAAPEQATMTFALTMECADDSCLVSGDGMDPLRLTVDGNAARGETTDDGTSSYPECPIASTTVMSLTVGDSGRVNGTLEETPEALERRCDAPPGAVNPDGSTVSEYVNSTAAAEGTVTGQRTS